MILRSHKYLCDLNICIYEDLLVFFLSFILKWSEDLRKKFSKNLFEIFERYKKKDLERNP